MNPQRKTHYRATVTFLSHTPPPFAVTVYARAWTPATALARATRAALVQRQRQCPTRRFPSLHVFLERV